MTNEREIREEIGKLIVKFKPGIRTDGEIVRVILNQFGGHIDLSAEQARSLASVIRAKLGE